MNNLQFLFLVSLVSFGFGFYITGITASILFVISYFKNK